MQKEPLVSIILVNFNGRQFLEWCLSSLTHMKVSQSFYEIIVVDNNSWDNSVPFIHSHFPEVKVIESPVNLGFAGGNNLGVNKAKGKYVVLLNNDTIVEANWLHELVSSIEGADSNVAVINGKSLLFFPFVELSIQSDTCPKVDIIASGDFRPVGVLLERVLLVDKSLQHFLHFQSGFYEKEQREQIGSWTNGNAKLLVPFHPGATHLDLTLTIRTLRTNTGDKTRGKILLGDETIKEFVLEPQDVIRCDVICAEAQLKKHRFFMVQNAGNVVFKNGFVRDIGAAAKKDLQVYERDGAYFRKKREVLAFCGVNVLFRKEVFQKLGGFDESFFMYYEDADLSLRLYRMGYRIMYEPKAIVHHIHSGSSGQLSTFVYYYAERNHLAFVWKQFPWTVVGIQTLTYVMSWFVPYLRMLRWGIHGSWAKYEWWEEKASYRWRVFTWLVMNIPRLIGLRLKINKKQKRSMLEVYKTLY